MSDIDLALAGLWGERAIAPMAAPVSPVSPVGAIKAYFNETWPELKGIKDLWLTGGQVWRRFYGAELNAKDADMFVTTKKSLKRVEAFMASLKPGEDNSCYMGPLGGSNYITTRGRVDLWWDESAKKTLRRYSDVKAHARMAFNPSSGRLIVLANEVVRKPGEKYIATNPDGSLTWRIE